MVPSTQKILSLAHGWYHPAIFFRLHKMDTDCFPTSVPRPHGCDVRWSVHEVYLTSLCFDVWIVRYHCQAGPHVKWYRLSLVLRLMVIYYYWLGWGHKAVLIQK